MSYQSVWLRRYSKLVVFATFGLIFLGALVKSFEVGLSVPDWPTTYGYQMFAFPLNDMVGGILYEHSHRIFATFVGALTLFLALWLSLVEKRTNIKRLGYIALALVIVQGMLGGLTVMFFLPAAISIIHGITAQIFLLEIILIAYVLSKEFNSDKKLSSANSKLIYILFTVIFFQLVLGSWMRHTESGLAIYDFPQMAGQWIPFFNESTVQAINLWRFDMDLEDVMLYQVWIHFSHRFTAFIILIISSVIGYRHYKNRHNVHPVLSFNLSILFTLILFQSILGMYTIWSMKSPIITSVHVVNGAAVLGMSFLLLLRTSSLSLLK